MENQSSKYRSLTQGDLKKIRQHIDPISYKRSMTITFFWFGLDLAFYLLSMYGVFKATGIFSKLFFGILAGVATSSMFVWAHDAAHGALFKNNFIAEVLGTIFMLPALTMYRLWSHGHNRIHHGFTSYSFLDWIWRPLTIAEYNELKLLKKICYKIERNFLGSGLHYMYKVWWPKMVMFKASDPDPRKNMAVYIDKIIVAIFVTVVGASYFVHGGLISAVSAVIVPFLIFNYVISLIVYLHHTHPKIPFFDDRVEWNHTIGALYCTTIISSNWLIDVLTHNIMVHTPHHLDVRIPFYRLKQAVIGIKSNYNEYLHEYKINIATLLYIFRTCKLYDYKKHVWYSFKEAKALKY